MHTMHTMHDAHTMDHAPRHNHTVPHCHRDSCHAAVFIMGKDLRAIFSRRHSYATKSNKTLKVKTPGGSLVLHQLKKLSKGPRCGETGVTLHGIKKLKMKAYKNVHKREKTVKRAYGGSLCGKAVRDRILRAFLIEEQKIVKKIESEKKK
mmetsp:Transcript_41195/g.109975  ORF Transcript_41195/g.109975 Transcript_41195/m.109975 type:complete len:150 (-) Transcript_41195:169-618(-)